MMRSTGRRWCAEGWEASYSREALEARRGEKELVTHGFKENGGGERQNIAGSTAGPVKKRRAAIATDKEEEDVSIRSILDTPFIHFNEAQVERGQIWTTSSSSSNHPAIIVKGGQGEDEASKRKRKRQPTHESSSHARGRG